MCAAMALSKRMPFTHTPVLQHILCMVCGRLRNNRRITQNLYNPVNENGEEGCPQKKRQCVSKTIHVSVVAAGSHEPVVVTNCDADATIADVLDELYTKTSEHKTTLCRLYLDGDIEFRNPLPRDTCVKRWVLVPSKSPPCITLVLVKHNCDFTTFRMVVPEISFAKGNPRYSAVVSAPCKTSRPEWISLPRGKPSTLEVKHTNLNWSKMTQHRQRVSTFAWSHNGNMLAILFPHKPNPPGARRIDTNYLDVWRYDFETDSFTSKCFSEQVGDTTYYDLCWNSNDTLICTKNACIVEIVDIQTQKTACLGGRADFSFAWHPTIPSQFVTCDYTNKVQIWKVDFLGEKLSILSQRSTSIQDTFKLSSVCWTPCGQFVMVGITEPFDRHIVWTLKTGKQEVHEDPTKSVFVFPRVNHIAWHPNLPIAARLSYDGHTIEIWEHFTSGDCFKVRVLGSASLDEVGIKGFRCDTLEWMDNGTSLVIRIYRTSLVIRSYQLFGIFRTGES